jgi:SAM-dependent methyltransferase
VNSEVGSRADAYGTGGAERDGADGPVAVFARLLTPEGAALLEELRDLPAGGELAAATRLRRAHDAALVSAALGQAALRRRAEAKFGAADAHRMFFTPNGVEQSTRRPVAEHRAARFAALGVRRLADLCCGNGGDAIAAARAGISVLAVDRDPLACAATAASVRALGLDGLVEVREADATMVDLAGFDAVFADPARRGGRGRVFDPEAYAPPLSWAVRAARSARVGAVKVAPGIPHDAVPADAGAEWVSHRGEVKEAVLWFGAGAAEPSGGGRFRAVLLPGGAELSGGALPDPAVREAGRYLYEPDGAVIRAHLVAEVAAELDGGLIDPAIAYVTADTLRPTPFATAYALTDVLPFNLKRLKAIVRERGIGVLTVKKRGSAVEPEEVRRRVKPSGPHSATVFLTRAAGAPVMLLGAPAGDGAVRPAPRGC